jgi:hypothetical protein
VFYVFVAVSEQIRRRKGSVNPQLRILKGKTTKDYTPRRRLRFAIIDKDQTREYPTNFICILPQHMNTATAEASVFAKTFQENRADIAKRLLTDALQREQDPQIKKEIESRLRQLEPRYIWQRNFQPK